MPQMDLRALRWTDLRFLLGLLLPAVTLQAVLQRPHTAALRTVAVWWTVTVLEATSPALQRSPPAAAPGSGLGWLLQSLFAAWLLETVNYVEHYGLQRRIGADGRPEPFGPAHAWNADHLLSNSMLANLQRHSDHHTHAWKPFAQLQALPQAPQLPTGYAGAILLAALPPLWFRVMHARLAAAA